MSNSLQPHGLWHSRLLCPWDFAGKNTGVGCHFLLQGIFPTQGLNLGLHHCRQIPYCLSHQGSSKKMWTSILHPHRDEFCHNPSEQEIDYPLQPPEGNTACQHFTFSLVRSYERLQNWKIKNMCCFKTQNFVMKTVKT